MRTKTQSSPPQSPHQIGLEDKYALESGRALMSGIQALVRLALDQRRLDRRRGLSTGVFVSGYPGSPLAGVDREFQRAEAHLKAAGAVFQPALNEELAATAVAGTQLLGELPGRQRDGVAGFWFGKAPGLDRAADAIRHGNISGTATKGGAVAWVGDDPEGKSSTIPSSSEQICRSLSVPLFSPGTVADVIELGLHAVALSRAAGLWTAMKIVPEVADAAATVELGLPLDGIPEPPPADRGKPPILLAASSVEAEHDLLTARLERVAEYTRATRLNRITSEPDRARLGIAAAGVAYENVVRALDDLGLDINARQALGIRLIRFAISWPIDREVARELTDGLEEVLVVEDKLPFIESQLKELLYRTPGSPLVLGKSDEDGRPLLPVRGTLSADDVARAIASRLRPDERPEAVSRRLELVAEREQATTAPALTRTPYFCSGCPHNISTRASADQLVGVGIGCHTMVVLDEIERGRFTGMTQMGGEGAQWLGLSAFTDDEHFFQNLGDGTFHHSGSLAIRAAVAAGANMTYKLLYNDAIAMTGGQPVPGRLDVPTLTGWFANEGVKRVVVVTDEPSSYRKAKLAPIAEVRHRNELAAVQEELSAIEGVTVLLYDDRCAAEERRLRKRGKLPTPTERVHINERVCEGCGDCGEKSSCLSVVPIETEFGRKTQIHQSSCNFDFSCLEGDCPSFLLIEPTERAEARAAQPPTDLPDPEPLVSADNTLIRMPGIGGTGVVTVSQVLQMAALLDGKHAAGLDQTGLAQKGGPVISDVRISASPIHGALRASCARVDALLGFDLLGAADAKTLTVLDPERTVAVVNTAQVPTAATVTDIAATFPPAGSILDEIERVTRADDNFYLDAIGLAERLYADSMPANMILIGAAYQQGCIPLSAEALEQALRLNGAAVERSIEAFRWGRAAVALPTKVASVMEKRPSEAAPLDRESETIIDLTGADGELRRLLEARVPDLVDYQDAQYARSYADSVADVMERERQGAAPGESGVAEAYASNLHKLMAYKDEYEVARLHLGWGEKSKVAGEFGPDAKVSLLLHPPLLRSLGLKRKIRLRRTAGPLMWPLRRMSRLRGTALDPFGRSKVRRTERALIGEYRQAVDQALDQLSPGNHDQVLAIAELPDIVRGYEDIKLANVERYRSKLDASLAKLGAAHRAGSGA